MISTIHPIQCTVVLETSKDCELKGFFTPKKESSITADR